MSEPNITLTGDYLWTNMNVGEVFPDTLTPSTWSVWQELLSNMSFGDAPAYGTIAGRPYLNYSLVYSFLLKFKRQHEKAMAVIGDSIGTPPDGVDIPSFPVPWRTVVFQLLPREFRNEVRKDKLRKTAPEYLASLPDRCQELKQGIEEAQGTGLVSLWTDDIRPLWKELYLLQDKMNEDLAALTRKLKEELAGYLGEDKANTLGSTISSSGNLASLGPLVGLSKVKSGELSEAEYLRHHGHRGPHENELAEPRSYEDPDWLPKQLAELDKAPLEVSAMLAGRDTESNAARQEIARLLPSKQAEGVLGRIGDVQETNTIREATRSELTRIVDVIRAFFLRAGALGGLDDGVFFLTIDEVIELLSGDTSVTALIPGRQEEYERFRVLPTLPSWIRGRFDPIQWAADPERRMDVYDPQAPEVHIVAGGSSGVSGQPGSAGIAEGLVRRIDSPDKGHQLQAGEVLVAATTNVGWTPLFPRAAAVVTDSGGSLSHAAIVARELGIPAVVGCGDATIRLRTGDFVRVDGGSGIVETLEQA